MNITQEELLINEYKQRLTNNSVPVIYNLRHLRMILQISKADQDYYFGKYRGEQYHRFEIRKKSGGTRYIDAPCEDLKIRQRWIKENIIDKIPVSMKAKGFRKKLSIYDNAVLHINQELVVTIDIQDFFPSVRYKDVYRIFYYMGYNYQVSHLLTKMCTNQYNVLPQGAPTSPGISNIILLKLDKRLGRLADTYNCNYSRYADDITFSGKKSIINLIPTAITIIKDEGFRINEKKTRFLYSNQRQIVTGLVVNDKVSIPKKLIKELENAIYYCKKYGVLEHMRKINCQKAFYKEHLYGIAYYVKMIDEKKGVRYLKGLDEIEWLY